MPSKRSTAAVVDALNEICEVDSLDPSIHQPFRSTIDPMITDGSVMAWKALGAIGVGVLLFFATQWR